MASTDPYTNPFKPALAPAPAPLPKPKTFSEVIADMAKDPVLQAQLQNIYPNAATEAATSTSFTPTASSGYLSVKQPTSDGTPTNKPGYAEPEVKYPEAEAAAKNPAVANAIKDEAATIDALWNKLYPKGHDLLKDAMWSTAVENVVMFLLLVGFLVLDHDSHYMKFEWFEQPVSWAFTVLIGGKVARTIF